MHRVPSVLARVAGRVTAALALPLFVLNVAGCNVLGVAAYKLAPPPKVPALYVPAQEPMLVLAESYDSPAATRTDAERITRHVTDELARTGVAPMVDPAEVERVRAERSAAEFRRMPIPAVGRAAGAAQVLYVNLVSFDLTGATGSEMVRGEAEARVRVVDATTGETRWPLDTAEGYPVSVRTAYVKATDSAAEMSVRREIYQTMAGEIARLFYAWDAEGIDGGAPVE